MINENGRNIYSMNRTFNHDNYNYASNPNINRTQTKPFGTTALENARKSLDLLKDKKEDELFKMLQHKIKSEHLKYKTADKFCQRQKKFEDFKKEIDKKNRDILNEKKIMQKDKFLYQNALYERLKESSRVKNNLFQYRTQNKEKNMKNKNKKKIEDLQIKKEEEDWKNCEVQNRLNILNENDQKRRNEIGRILKKKCEKRISKLARKANEQKIIKEQLSYEKRQEINANLEIIKKRQIQFNKSFKEKEKNKIKTIDRIRKKKQEEFEERKLQNRDRLEDHEYRINLIKQNDSKKNKNYFIKKEKHEEKLKLINKEKERKKEERKIIMGEKDAQIKNNLKYCEMKFNNFINSTEQKIKNREEDKNRIMEKKKLNHINKINANYQLEKEMEYKINEMRLNDSINRDKEREILDKKKNDTFNFYNKKQNINNQKRIINDSYNNQRIFYSNRIDELMYRKPMNQNGLRDVRYILSGNPRLASIVDNIQ